MPFSRGGCRGGGAALRGDGGLVTSGRLLVEKLKEGRSIALVSDSGTPGISDPGYFVVNLAIENGVEVISIPGASALLCGLAAAGAPTDRFTFEMLKDYLDHLGLQPFDEYYYLPEGKGNAILLDHTGTANDVKHVSLEEARRMNGIED